MAQQSDEDELESSTRTNLCCCENLGQGRVRERLHILGYCCDYCRWGLAFIHLHTSKLAYSRDINNMLLTFQDRLRIPWRGGAKQVALDVWFSALMVALVLGIAAINVYTAVIMFLASLIFIGYAYYYVSRSLIRTRIFAFWLVWSVAYMSVLMEFAVPLLEFLPEEHLILVILSCISAYCFWTTYRRSQLNFVMQSSVTEDELPDITEVTAAEEEEAEAAAHTALLMESIDSSTAVDSSMCNTCHKYVPARTVHCQLCGACILRRDHHSYWLNCCIGQWNHIYYLLGLIFGILALLLCANLTLTAVCHPFLVVRLFGVAVMLPDDCTEVFDEYTLSLSFIVALYALLMTCYMLVALVKQICKISRNSNTVSGRRNHANGTLTKWLSNWKAFLF